MHWWFFSFVFLERMTSPLLKQKIEQPAAIMYFAFFAVGVLSGTILTAGGKKGGKSSVKTDK